MEHKFESTYFRFKGAQDRCYEWGDENLHQFFVAIDGPLKYEYASYKDSTTFLKAYDSVPEEERYFFEQIRDGKACKEYYDIDWNLAYSPDECEIKRQEQQVFNAFLNARNQHAPDYPLDATHCRVLSSSKNKKISLHIVIPTYVFENNRHMGVFVLAFKDSWKLASDEDSARSKRIDGGVYSRNRNMRILGSCKFKDTGRPLQRAHWHESSMVAEDEEFLITNPGPDSTRVSPIEYVKEPKKKVVAIRTGQIARTPEEDETELPQGVVDAVRALLMNDASLSHFEVGRFHGGRLQLMMRTRAGHCKLCSRIHDSDNAFATITRLGQVYFYCYRDLADNKQSNGLKVGDLDFAGKVALRSHWAQTNLRDTITANVTCSDRYLDYTKLYKNNKSLLICSEPDTGKTAFVEGYMKHHPEDLQYIFVSPRQSFSRNLEKRLVLENYLDFTGLVSGQRIVIQAESLARLDTEFYTGEFVLVLDEVCSVFSQMTSIATMGRHHRINNQLLESLMRRAKTVLALDADMTDREVEIIKAVRDDIWVIHNTFKPLRDHQVILYPTADMLETKVIDMINAGEKVWVTCTRSAEYAKSLHNTLKGMGRHGLCVTADTSESEKKRISQNINEVVRDLDYFIHTPTITVGIDCNVQHFDTVVGFFVAQSNVNVESCRQMLRRPRKIGSKKYLIHIQNATNNLPTGFNDLVLYLQSQEVRLKGCTLDTAGFPFVTQIGQPLSIDKKALYTLIFIATLSRCHSSMNDFLQRFIDQMVVAGCTIHTETSLEENQEYTAIISQTAEALLQAKCKGIADARLLNIFEAEELMAKPGREQSQTDKYALEKHMLIKAYKVKDASIVTSEWVRTYNSPREIKVFKNLSEFKANPALDIIAHTDKKGLEMDQDDENVIDVIHKLSDPLSFKLKYAKDILGACGFDSPFDDKSITAAEIKRDIDLYWSRLVEGRNMKDICIQLKIRCPTYRVWDFKNKKNFMNSVLNEVWGIHVTGVNRKALSYHIK